MDWRTETQPNVFAIILIHRRLHTYSHKKSDRMRGCKKKMYIVGGTVYVPPAGANLMYCYKGFVTP